MPTSEHLWQARKPAEHLSNTLAGIYEETGGAPTELVPSQLDVIRELHRELARVMAPLLPRIHRPTSPDVRP